MAETERELARLALEDAVYRFLEAGATPAEVREEVEYAVDSMDDDL